MYMWTSVKWSSSKEFLCSSCLPAIPTNTLSVTNDNMHTWAGCSCVTMLGGDFVFFYIRSRPDYHSNPSFLFFPKQSFFSCFSFFSFINKDCWSFLLQTALPFESRLGRLFRGHFSKSAKNRCLSVPSSNINCINFWLNHKGVGWSKVEPQMEQVEAECEKHLFWWTRRA